MKTFSMVSNLSCFFFFIIFYLPIYLFINFSNYSYAYVQKSPKVRNEKNSTQYAAPKDNYKRKISKSYLIDFAPISVKQV